MGAVPQPQDIWFDLEEIPESMQVEDGIEQNDVLVNIFIGGHRQPVTQRSFERETPVKINLQLLRKQYERKQAAAAISLMQRRVRVELDDRSTIDTRDPSLCWHGSNYFIDYMLLVSSSIGLHAILPNVDTDPGYFFRMQLNQPYRAF
jgi:hypothetical protein